MLKKLIIIFSITLNSVIGIVSVSPILPKIAEYFNIQADKTSLVIAFFALPGLIFTPFLGFLADKFGRKSVLIPALALFSVSGVACSFAESFEMLLIFRFLQGIGAASLGAINIVLIGDLFEKENQVKIVGYNHSILSLGTAIFPIIAGKIGNIAWQFVFLMPLFGILTMILILLLFEEKYKTKKKKNFKKSISIIKKDKRFLLLFFISFLTFVILLGPFLSFLPFIIENKFSATPLQIGFALSLMSFTNVLVAPFLSKLVKALGHKNLLVLGFLGYGIALLLIPFWTNYNYIFISSFLFGFSHSINLPNVQSILVKISPDNSRAFLVSFNRMISQLGQFSGPVLAGLIFSISFFDIEKLDLVFYFFSILSIIISISIAIIMNLVFKNYEVQNE